jgi:hypothetical protein
MKMFTFILLLIFTMPVLAQQKNALTPIQEVKMTVLKQAINDLYSSPEPTLILIPNEEEDFIDVLNNKKGYLPYRIVNHATYSFSEKREALIDKGSGKRVVICRMIDVKTWQALSKDGGGKYASIGFSFRAGGRDTVDTVYTLKLEGTQWIVVKKDVKAMG